MNDAHRRLICVVACAGASLVGVCHAQAKRSPAAYHSNEQVIRAVFGVYGDQAVRVARCESGLSTWAHNGQYLGILQMGSRERARYGHGNDVWSQARAAFRYFVASGRDWSPWACKPW